MAGLETKSSHGLRLEYWKSPTSRKYFFGFWDRSRINNVAYALHDKESFCYTEVQLCKAGEHEDVILHFSCNKIIYGNWQDAEFSLHCSVNYLAYLIITIILVVSVV